MSKSKIVEFCQKNMMKIIVFLITINTLGSLWIPSKDLVAYAYQDQIRDIVTFIIANSVKEEIERARIEYSLELLKLETKDIRTPADLDKKVKNWKKGSNCHKIAALNIVFASPLGRAILRKIMYNEQIYKTLKTYSR